MMNGAATPVTARPLAIDPEIAGLTADSRKVRPGYLFAALPGTQADGRDFIADALARGAVAVLAPPGAVPSGAMADTALDGQPIAIVTDDNPRRRLALMAARFFGRQPRAIAAVTGTNGKTSVTTLTRQIWERLGLAAASIGTLGVSAPKHESPGALTTPDPVALHRLLRKLADDGVDHLILEASSHGLDQFRLDGVRVTAAGFTNLTRDHLDYHGDMDAYLKAKLRLFEAVMAPGGTAVLNADAPEFDALAQSCTARGHEIVSYGANGQDLRLDHAEAGATSQRLRLTVFGRTAEITLPLAGIFQAHNTLCALGLAIACGANVDAAIETLECLRGAPGRMQLIARHPSGAPVYVDYAHTPDALEKVLTALRPHARRRLVVVFGCGGDRDPGKRPLMGAISARLADRVIVTDDNPRGEDPAAIRRQILAGAATTTTGTGADMCEIGARAEAITTAITGLGPGDVLVIAGKGHEQGQIVAGKVLPFDDAAIARAVIAKLSGDAP